MAKVTITGKAQKEYTYDIMELTIRFQVHARSSSEALKQVLTECEEFLGILYEQGVSSKDVHLGKDDVSQYYNDGKLDVTATREVKMRIPYNMSFYNELLKQISDRKYDADIDVNPEFSDDRAIRMELTKLAFEDSKAAVEQLAAATDMKITGIEKITQERYDSNPCLADMAAGSPRMYKAAFLPHSNELQNPTSTEEDELTVIWILE